MGQQDPLVAWQRDGFAMFGDLMDSIDDDYLRYVLHVEAIDEQAAEPDLAQAVYEAADDPVTSTLAVGGQFQAEERAAGPAAQGPTVGSAPAVGGTVQLQPPPPRRNGRAKPPVDPDTLVPTVKADHEKVGRNDPCWCGSGKKFKLCHGGA
jgi:preprotein translocase subunit SecA